MRQQQKHPLLYAAICAIVFIMTEFFGSRYFGPLSLRNYALLFGLVLPLLSGYIPNKDSFKSFRFLIAYYIFVMVLGLFNGLYLDDIGRDLVLARFVPMVIIFFLLTATLNHHKARLYFVYFLLLIIAIDAIVTILQGTGNAIGWAVGSFFDGQDLMDLTEEEGNSVGSSTARGITGTVVANGFLLSGLGLLYWVPYYSHRTNKSFLVSLFLWLLFLVALFFNQQRMAFYVFLLFSAVITVLLSRTRVSLFIIIGLIICIALFSDLIILGKGNLGRLSEVTTEVVAERHIYHNIYIEEFLPYHFLSGDRHEYVATYGFTPHNMIIETLLLGGIVGLIIYVIFIISFCGRVFRAIKNRNKELLLYSLPIIAVLLISWEHSAGFHTGMTLGAYCLALFELVNNESIQIIRRIKHH